MFLFENKLSTNNLKNWKSQTKILDLNVFVKQIQVRQYYKFNYIQLVIKNFFHIHILSMENQIICPHCSEEYRDNNLPRLLIGCGHTFCQACLLSFIQDKQGQLWTKCPEDGTEHQIKQRNVSKFPKNLALIKVIESKKDILSFKQAQINVSKITKNSSIHEEQDTTQLISMIDTSPKQANSPKASENSLKASKKQSSKSTSKSKSKLQSKQLICPTHKKPMDIVCTVDLQKICASCAIFGEHKGHDFKSLEEVSQIHNQYVEDITSIIEEKQKLEAQLSCCETKNQIIGLLTTKRNKLREKVIQEFQKLESKILNKKKDILKKLDEIVKKQQTNLKNCIKFDDELIQNYNVWFKKSDSQLKVLQENDFQAKLILLFEGKNIDGDLVAEGQQLIDQMKSQEEKIFVEVQKKLENLNMTLRQDIYQHIDEFIVINSQNKNQKTMYASVQPKNDQFNLYIPLSHNFGKSSMANSKIRAQVTERRAQPTQKYEMNKTSYLQPCESANITHNLDQSLLQNEQNYQPDQPDVVQFSLRMSEMVVPSLRVTPLSERLSIQPNIETPLQKCEPRMKVLKNPVSEVMQVKCEKMTKKRLSKMKLPERFQKIVESLLTDSIQILDLTNAQIGDTNMSLICENVANSKVRTLKLIRNKLTDDGIIKILPFCGQITVLNISQNLLSDNILDILWENKKFLNNMRTVILSQNKINQRKNKAKIDRLKKLEWNVSI